MNALSHKDTLALLESINIIHSDLSWETLPDRTLKAMDILFPSSSMTAFDGIDPDGDYGGSLWYSPPGTVPKERVEILGELIHQHPTFLEIINTPHEQTYRTSDDMPLREFHRTKLYNEFYRTFDGEAQMVSAIRVSPTWLVTCSIHRPKADFSDREVAILGLITPHLRTALKNARELENLIKARNGLSRVAGKGIVILGTNREIVFISDLARGLLTKYFPTFTDDKLPADLVRFVEDQNRRLSDQDYFEPPDTLRVRSAGSELNVRLAFDFTAGELTLILEEKIEFSLDQLSPLGLTKRETEVMFWLCQGKTDAVIGELCGISVRTVQKHVENIFAKLAVETRSAAVATAYERAREPQFSA